jgi:WD40 repeat protein
MEFVAVVSASDVICVYDLERGDLICMLHDKGAERIESMAIAGEGYGAAEEEVCDFIDRIRLVAGHEDGIVRIWDLEAERCVNTPHPMFGLQHSYSRGVPCPLTGVASCISRIQIPTTGGSWRLACMELSTRRHAGQV